MLDNNIIKCTPFDKKISIIIHLNYSCNFKCSYCIAWLEVSNDYLSMSNVDILFNTIKRLYNNKWKIIEVDINWWDPTLHKDFSQIVTKFLTINDIKLQVSTNGYLLYSLRNKFFNKELLLNRSKLKFNISFHYFEYKDKVETFIKSINLLIKYNINFKIKFLLPDNNESLDDFLIIRNYIFEKTWLQRNNYEYFLIMNFKWWISKTYNKEMLKFYYNLNDNLHDDDFRNQLDWVLVEYSDWKKINFTQEELKSKWINNFKWFNCLYITNNIALIYIAPNWEVTFWSCILLDKKKFHLDKLESMLFSWNKSILCTHTTCTSWLNLPKVKSTDYYKIYSLENLLTKTIKKVIKDIKVEDIQIALKDRLILIFKIDFYNINLIIEKKNSYIKYHFSKNNIWYNLRIKDDNNIVYNINNIKKEYALLINKNIQLLSSLDSLYKKII